MAGYLVKIPHGEDHAWNGLEPNQDTEAPKFLL